MATLKQAIQEFVRQHPQWSTQKGALYECVCASEVFIRWIEEYYPKLAKQHELQKYTFFIKDVEKVTHGDERDGLNPNPKLYTIGSNEIGRVKADWHCIVQTRHFLIDLTAKQYTEAAEYPTILSKKRLLARVAAAGGA